ncbi:MAG TPA: Ig-like domain-containing protein, partial [Vineibacter sp.]|nr:Ig-like domain-containing protein [Vineibacter sp.]
MATTTSTDFGATLNAAVQGGYVAHLSGQTYTITEPIVIHVTRTTQGALGIDGGGATLVSQVTNGAPLIQIVVDPGVDFRYLTLSNFTIAGNGREGDGIQIVADGNDRWVYNWTIDNVTVQHVGGYGLDVQGSVFEGSVCNSWMIDNAKGGAAFAHSAGGGQVSALRWFGGGFKDNGGAGLVLDNGARDMTVDGAAFVNNADVGISAAWGISAVSSSTFQDNHGVGVWFQNYGNFNNNTFTTSGAQSIGIKGYLAGNATLVGNTSTYTGTGSDPTSLADLQGNGGAFLASDSGKIVTGSSVAVSGVGGGNEAHVVVDSHGVALPTLAAVDAGTTAAAASSAGSGVLESALRSAIAGGTVAHLTDNDVYTVTAPIVINITSSIATETGIDLGGAKIISQIAGGGPVITFIVGPGVDVSHLTLSNFSVLGNGGEGDGIKIVVDGTDRVIRDLSINNVNVEHVGGIGLDVLGNVSHGTVFESWMHGNGDGGARFANSAGGGIASGLEWIGGGFRKNGGAGLILDNGTHDMTVRGAYFVDNYGPGLYATSGITLVRDSGFENNQDVGAIVGNSANFVDVGFATYGVQKTGIGGFLSGGQVTLTGVGGEYYGWDADPTVLANVQGNGTLAMVGGGKVVVGPSVTVTGGNPVIGPPADTTAPALVSIAASGAGIDTGNGALNAGDAVTLTVAFSEAVTVAGGTPTLVLNDGGTATYTGGSGGSALSFTHTVQAGHNAADLAVVSINLNGATIKDGAGNAANLAAAANYNPAGTLRIDTAAPAVTERLASDTGASASDKITANPALTGTAESGAVVHFTVDGKASAVTATANASGAWLYAPTGLADGQHTIIASQTDAAGNTGTASLTFKLDTTAPVVTERLASGGGTTTSSPALSGTGDPSTLVRFTIDGQAIAGTATA